MSWEALEQREVSPPVCPLPSVDPESLLTREENLKHILDRSKASAAFGSTASEVK